MKIIGTCNWRCLVVCLGLLCICAPADAVAQDETSDKNASLNQKAMSAEVVVKSTHRFLLYLPDDYEAKDKVPLMLFLHGAGERGDGNLELVAVHGPPKHIKNGKKFPCIVVSPQCEKGKWWDAADLSALLDHIEANYKVDKDRIYVTGLSMGGYGTWALSIREPNRFAAVAPVCGGGNPRALRRVSPTPTWCFHGAKDYVVPLSQSEEMVNVLKKMDNAEVKFTVYPEIGHNAWDPAYSDELYDWLFSHSLESNQKK